MIITGNRRRILGRKANAGTDSSNNGQVLYHCIHYRNVHKMDCVWIQEIFYRCVVLAWLCYRWGKFVTPFLIIAIYLVYNTLCFIEFTVSLPDSLSVNVIKKTFWTVFLYDEKPSWSWYLFCYQSSYELPQSFFIFCCFYRTRLIILCF